MLNLISKEGELIYRILFKYLTHRQIKQIILELQQEPGSNRLSSRSASTAILLAGLDREKK